MHITSRFRVNSPKVVHEMMDREVVIVEFDSGNYYSLDREGADIWNLLACGATFGEIVERLMQLYRCNPPEMKQAVARFIDELQKEHLIVPVKAKKEKRESKPANKAVRDSSKEIPAFVTPRLQKYTDMQELLLLDPIHEVDEKGWPSTKPQNSDE